MSIASNLAGKAISISKTTAPHATSYPFTSLFQISHGHAVSLFFENFFKFNFNHLERSETSFDLKKRYDLIFKIFEVKNIQNFTSKISLIKKKANLEDNLLNLKINLKSNSNFTEIIISDDGNGYPNDILSKIGEPYLKSFKQKNKEKAGLGLGLFIGKTLLEKNFASLNFGNSEILGGAEVVIRWKNKDLFNL